MADLIAVSPATMREKGNTLKSSANTIRTLTEELKGEISKMKTSWEGEAAEKFVLKFNGLNDDFQERYDVINQYGQFLLDAADAFEKNERDTVSLEDGLS